MFKLEMFLPAISPAVDNTAAAETDVAGLCLYIRSLARIEEQAAPQRRVMTKL